MTVIFPLGILALLLVLMVRGQHDENRVLSRWEMRLNPEGLQIYEQVATEVLWNHRMIDSSYGDARYARANGNVGEALRFLDLGAQVVESCSPSLLAFISNIGALARFAEAVAPLAPLRPQSFNAGRFVTLAGIHQVFHYLLVTTRERLQLRLAMVRYGIRSATWLLIKATWETKARIDLDERWRHMDALRADLATFSDESLQTLRAVLASLAAVRRPIEAPARKTA